MKEQPPSFRSLQIYRKLVGISFNCGTYKFIDFFHYFRATTQIT